MTGKRLFPEAKNNGWRLFLEERSDKTKTFSEEKWTGQVLFLKKKMVEYFFVKKKLKGKILCPEEKNDGVKSFS